MFPGVPNLGAGESLRAYSGRMQSSIDSIRNETNQSCDSYTISCDLNMLWAHDLYGTTLSVLPLSSSFERYDLARTASPSLIHTA